MIRYQLLDGTDILSPTSHLVKGNASLAMPTEIITIEQAQSCVSGEPNNYDHSRREQYESSRDCTDIDKQAESDARLCSRLQSPAEL